MAKNDDRQVPAAMQELFDLVDAANSNPGLKSLLEALLNTTMRMQADRHVAADFYERSEHRHGYRSGTKDRTLNTALGRLKLNVPQVRDCEPYHPTFFNRWERSDRALLVACSEMYFQGISTRRVRDVLESMCGFGLSAGEVSRVATEIDEKLATFRARSLAGRDYVYLIVDARYEKVRVNGQIVSQAVLVTAGISHDGQREILDWRVCDSESEESYKQVFRSLKDRGLRGVKLVVSDAHQGIRAAMDRHMQGTAWQRCRVHFIRELCSKAGSKHYRELAADIKTVFRAEERSECLRRAEEMAAKWQSTAPRIAAMLRDGLESCLTVCLLPPEHRRKLHSTNMLERVMRELKRRTRVVGIFPNAASCDRLIGARLMELHEHWQEAKAYLSMDALQRTEHRGVLEQLAGAAR